MPAMIIRTKKESGKYAMMHKAIFENPAISCKAKGLYAYLMTLPDDWRVMKSELPRHFRDGKASVYAAFDELVENGYVSKKWHDAEGKPLMDGSRPTCEFIVYEVPNAENQKTANADFRTLPNADFRTLPNADFRKSDFPNAENRTLLINHQYQETISTKVPPNPQGGNGDSFEIQSEDRNPATAKPKKKNTPPPTLEEWLAYAGELSPNWLKHRDNCESAYDYYEANGWKQNKGTPIKDWKAACRTCHRNWKERYPDKQGKSPTTQPRTMTDANAEKIREFVRRRYEPEGYSPIEIQKHQRFALVEYTQGLKTPEEIMR